MGKIYEIARQNSQKFKDKISFRDVDENETYGAFFAYSLSIASFLVEKRAEKVCILMNKSVKAINTLFGCVLAGVTYIILDSSSPIERLEKIVSITEPSFIIFDSTNEEKAKHLVSNSSALANYSSCVSHKENIAEIEEVQRGVSPDHIVYILFTSGSTGTPKGVMITEENIVSYMAWFTSCFSISEETIFGNQTPLYFSMSVSDLFASIFTGATFNIIPQICFSFPLKLVEFLNERKINTIYWVPSVFAIIDFFKIFDYVLPKYLKTVLFAGEVMQMKDLNYFRSKLPNCLFANLFGPTETTDICTYYKVDRTFSNSEPLPIGFPCQGLKCLLLKDGKECLDSEEGELYVGGPFVSPGYYHNEEKTKNAFVQNPLEANSKEILYRTGDLCIKNKYGELMFSGRADFQIKHMGYRIELGEIESALLKEQKVLSCAAFYLEKTDQIVMVYAGRLKEDEALDIIKKAVPYYMVPSLFVKTPNMQYNHNGKIDRKWYAENIDSLLKKKSNTIKKEE